MSSKLLTVQTTNPRVVDCSFQLRDQVVEKALQYKAALQQGNAELPFKEMVFFNVGDSHAVGQKPITFFRQVLACCLYPDVMEQNPDVFPNDVKERARNILKTTTGGLGSYTGAQGLESVRRSVCKFIEQRDGPEFGQPSPADLIMTDGGYDSTRLALETIIRDQKDGVLTPIPQYPMYSALITLLGGTQVPYELEENSFPDSWKFKMDVLESSLQRARSNGINVRAIIVNNPANPGGFILSEQNMREIVDFCVREKIILLADEVYQANSWSKERPFISFRRVASAMGYPDIEMFSFHSISKGYTAECGLRGGYLHMSTGIDADVKKQIIKMASIRLSNNTVGQVIMDLQCNPPKEGDESYPLFQKESEGIMNSLAKRATYMAQTLNSIPSISCSAADGSLFVFPRINLPAKAIEEATSNNMKPDTFYCMRLLDTTGVCVSSGSIFGQKEGTFHVRLTIMPPEEKVVMVMDKWRQFHEEFLKKYE